MGKEIEDKIKKHIEELKNFLEKNKDYLSNVETHQGEIIADEIKSKIWEEHTLNYSTAILFMVETNKKKK